MGFIRGSIVFILASLLFISLFLGNFFLTLNLSLNYNHVEPYLKNLTNNIAKDLGSKGVLLQEYNSERTICLKESSVNFTYEENKIEVPCNIINKDAKSTIDYILNETIQKIYYKNYKCEFLDCLKTENNKFVLISEKGKEYWGNKFYSTLFISFIIFLLIFLFAKERHTSFTLAGFIIILSALPFKQINWLISLLPDLLPFKIIPILFSESTRVFSIMLIFGVLFILFGISFSFFKWGRRIINFYEKITKKGQERNQKESSKKLTKEDVKDIVEEEIKDSKKNKIKKKIKKS